MLPYAHYQCLPIALEASGQDPLNDIDCQCRDPTCGGEIVIEVSVMCGARASADSLLLRLHFLGHAHLCVPLTALESAKDSYSKIGHEY